jgi:YesN/AraC family two-component response regulator
MTETTILIVDDAVEIRRVIEALIDRRRKGWRVVGTASNGAEGIERAREQRPDLVLLDISMPVMDGIEALPGLREVVPSALIVILTGFPASAARESALRAGADGFLEKDDLVRNLIPRLEAIIAAGNPHARAGTDGRQRPAPAARVGCTPIRPSAR